MSVDNDNHIRSNVGRISTFLSQQSSINRLNCFEYLMLLGTVLIDGRCPLMATLVLKKFSVSLSVSLTLLLYSLWYANCSVTISHNNEYNS